MTFRTKLRRSLMWRQHRLKRARLDRDHPLRYLFLEITRQCNLSCVYCGSDCTPRAEDAEMTIPEWIETIQQVARDFDARKIMVAVTGGEPLIKPGVLELFHELTRLGFRYGMVSNAQVIDEDYAKKLVAAGIGSISLSMDALPEVNDKLRGRGVSAGVERAIKALRTAGYKGKLEILSTITAPAISDLKRMRQYIAGLRVPLWRVAPVMPIGRAASKDALLPTAMHVREMLEYLLEARQDDYIPKPEFGEEGFLGHRFEGHIRPYLCQCNAGVTVAGIRYDGRIAACPELSDAFDQGSIRNQRFKDVWDNGYQVMRDRSWAKKGPCADCEHWDDCRGGALHLYEDTELPFTRCLYLMLKESDRQIATASKQPPAPENLKWYEGVEAPEP